MTLTITHKDVLDRAPNLTQDQVEHVIETCMEGFNQTQSINPESLDYAIESLPTLGNYYLVEVTVLIEGYEKHATHFVKSVDKENAELKALFNERHNDLEEGGDIFEDDIFQYFCNKVTLVTDPKEIEVLNKYK